MDRRIDLRLNSEFGVTFLFATHDPNVLDAARRVIRLVDGYAEAGYYEVVWPGRSASGGVLPSGIYLVRLATPGYSHTIKTLLLK